MASENVLSTVKCFCKSVASEGLKAFKVSSCEIMARSVLLKLCK